MKPIIVVACGLLACATPAAAGPHEKGSQLGDVQQQRRVARSERRELAAERRDLRVEQRELRSYVAAGRQRHRHPQLRYPRQVLHAQYPGDRAPRRDVRRPTRQR